MKSLRLMRKIIIAFICFLSVPVFNATAISDTLYHHKYKENEFTFYKHSEIIGINTCWIIDSIYNQKDIFMCGASEIGYKTNDSMWVVVTNLFPEDYSNDREIVKIERKEITKEGTKEIILYWTDKTEGNGGNSGNKGISIIDIDGVNLLFHGLLSLYESGWQSNKFTSGSCYRDVRYASNELIINEWQCQGDTDRTYIPSLDMQHGKYILVNGLYFVKK